MDWYVYVDVSIGAQAVKQPAEDFCKKCGTKAECYPKMTDKDIAEAYNNPNDLNFKREFDKIDECMVDPGLRDFNIATVQAQNKMGMRMKIVVGCVTPDDFTAHFKCAPHTVPGVKVLSGTINEEFHGMNFVAVPLHNIPRGLPYRELEVFSEVTNVVVETMLEPSQHFRQSLASEAFAALNAQTLGAREAHFKFSGMSGLMTYDDIKSKCEKIQEERRAAEEGGAGTGPMQPVLESTAPLPPRKRGVTPAILAGVAAPKGKAKAPGPAVPKRRVPAALPPAARGANPVPKSSCQAGVLKCQLDASASGSAPPASSMSVVPERPAVGGPATEAEAVYPSLSIVAILKGENLGRSLTGVLALESLRIVSLCVRFYIPIPRAFVFGGGCLSCSVPSQV